MEAPLTTAGWAYPAGGRGGFSCMSLCDTGGAGAAHPAGGLLAPRAAAARYHEERRLGVRLELAALGGACPSAVWSGLLRAGPLAVSAH